VNFLNRVKKLKTMQKYVSHKEVKGFKIEQIKRLPEGAALLMPDMRAEDGVEVNAAYVEKHKPAVDGYYVRYIDGYESWSPAGAFEEGYTLV